MDSNQNVPEPYPIVTTVITSGPTGSSTGYVLAVPSAQSASNDPLYTIQLISGETTSVTLSVMDKLVTDQSSHQAKLTLPSWIQHDAKVRLTLSRLTRQGRLILSPDNECFFIKKNKLGETIFKHQLPHFQFNYQSLLYSTTLQPDLTPSTKITANHATAKSLKNPCPLSLDKAIHTINPDCSTWLQSYDEEYNGLHNLEVFEPITLDHFRSIHPIHQEAFILELLSRHKLSDCNRSPRATPFKSGCPVDTITPSTLSPTAQTTLIYPYLQLMDDLTLLSISTRPDITAVLSLLSEQTHTPSQDHLQYNLHIIKYLASTQS